MFGKGGSPSDCHYCAKHVEQEEEEPEDVALEAEGQPGKEKCWVLWKFSMRPERESRLDCRSRLTLQQVARSTIPVQLEGHGFDASSWGKSETLVGVSDNLHSGRDGCGAV